MDTVTIYNQMKWKRVVEDLKFFLFLIVCYAQFFFFFFICLHIFIFLGEFLFWFCGTLEDLFSDMA